jgi:hypothetical protein
MKRFIVFLFISFFASQINAAMMPIDLNTASAEVIASLHDHCQEVATASHAEDGNSTGKSSATHYCCAVVAILTASPEFSSAKQIDVYSHSDISTPVTNLAESIYKPPRNYL